MHKTTVLRRPWLALCLSLGLGTALPAIAGEPAPDGHTARFEINFMEDMIDHHTMAIEMSALCQARTVHAELMEFCTNVVTAQQQERQKMQSWLADWYDVTKEPQLTEQEQAELTHLAMLSGAEFERNYLKRIIPHHFIAVMDSAECQVRVFHGELRDICRDAVVMQAQEIDTTRDWLCEWHDICALDMRRSAVVDRPSSQSFADVDSTKSGNDAPDNAGDEGDEDQLDAQPRA